MFLAALTSFFVQTDTYFAIVSRLSFRVVLPMEASKDHTLDVGGAVSQPEIVSGKAVDDCFADSPLVVTHHMSEVMKRNADGSLTIALGTKFQVVLSASQQDHVMFAVYDWGNLMVQRFLLLDLVFTVICAIALGSWLFPIGSSVLMNVVFYFCCRRVPQHYVTRNLAGVFLQGVCAVHIWQFGGLMEMHFFFFIGTTMQIIYKDPWCSFPSVAFIIGQHIIFT